MVRFTFSGFIIAALWGALRSPHLSLGELPAPFVTALAALAIVVGLAFTPRGRRLRDRAFQRWGSFARKNPLAPRILIVGALAGWQLNAVASLSAPLGWDVGIILDRIVRETDPSTYLSTYPNNTFLFFALSAVGVPAPEAFTHSWAFWALLSTAAVDLAVGLTILAARVRFGPEVGRHAFLLGVAALAVSPWIIVPYTDTLVLPLVGAALLLLAHWKPTLSTRYQCCAAGAGALLVYLTYLTKPSATALLAAALLCAAARAFANRRTHPWRSVVPPVVAFLAVLTVTAGAWHTFLSHQDVVHLDAERRMPISHFLAMGTNTQVASDGTRTYGSFSQADVDASRAESNLTHRSMHGFELYRSRMSEMGFDGYLRFVLLKHETNTSDGTFGWGREGDFIDETGERRSGTVADLTRRVYYPQGDLAPVFRFVSQGVWVGLLLLVLLSSRLRREELTVIRLALLLGLTFLIVFESGRSRYLIQYLPLLVTLGAVGLNSLFERVRSVADVP
ncbi:MAG: hypothetical protein NTX33_15510 [Propionibacteriales bacterium]|nr:hypothetical protein [Propionibacteriales bacterium]